MTTRHNGQSTVELAIVLPLVVVVALAVVQVAVTVRHQLAVESAAHAGARAAAASGRPHAAARVAAAHVTSLTPLEVTVTPGAHSVTVEVAFVDPTNVPFVGALLPDVVVRASATMRVEPP